MIKAVPRTRPSVPATFATQRWREPGDGRSMSREHDPKGHAQIKTLIIAISKSENYSAKKFFIPVNINWAEIAAMKIPVIFERMTRPCFPKTLSMKVELYNMSPMERIAPINPAVAKKREAVLFTLTPMTIKIPMAPGPMIMGIARGTTAISLSEESLSFVPSLLPLTSSTPERNKRAPAPILKASSVIPKMEKIYRPKKSKIKLMIMTEIVTFIARDFFSRPVASAVRVRKTDSTKKGVKMKNIFIKVEMNISTICLRHVIFAI